MLGSHRPDLVDLHGRIPFLEKVNEVRGQAGTRKCPKVLERTGSDILRGWQEACEGRFVDDPLIWTRVTAVEALAALGDQEALATIDRVAKSAAAVRLRRSARDAAKSLRDEVAKEARIADLARELAEEREEREKLARKVQRLEERLEFEEDDEVLAENP